MPLSQPTIYQRTINSGSFSGSVEQGLRFQNSYLVRQSKALVDNGWEWVRLGIRYRLFCSGSLISGSGAISPYTYNFPVFMMGICNGANVPGGASGISNCHLAASWWDGDDTRWVGNSNIQIYYNSNYGLNFFSGSKQRRIQYWDQGATGLSHGVVFTSNTCSCDTLILDIWRSSKASYNMNAFFREYNTYTPLPYYYTHEMFTTDMQQADMFKGGVYYQRTGYTYKVLEAQAKMSHSLMYPFDSIFLYYEPTDPPLEIIEFQIVKMR